MTTIANVEIERLQAINVEPGDIIIITMPEHATEQDLARLAEIIHGKFPGHEVFIKTIGVEVGVVRPVSPPV
jgi:hypothetical protein